MLQNSEGGQCTYAPCGDASVLEPEAEAAGQAGATNAAAMAAPAVVLTLAVVAFVEILMHCC